MDGRVKRKVVGVVWW